MTSASPLPLTQAAVSLSTAHPGAIPGTAAARAVNVSKMYGRGRSAVRALDDVSFTVRQGEFLCLVGASGSGKSTLLTLLAGLERPTSGTLTVSGGSPASMFQDAALFPWLTVGENVAFPLRMQGSSRKERQAEVRELLQLVQLEGAGRRRPHELSGGMRQRIALARALAQRAPVLLMDEPFRALDVRMRSVLQAEVERLWQARGLTIVFVTHDVEEAVRLGDRVLVLSGHPGRLASELAIALPRPRDVADPQVKDLIASLTAELWQEASHADR